MSKQNKVYIVDGGLDFTRMFIAEGWEVTDDIFSAQVVQFTGGSDVSPEFYNQAKHPLTHCNIIRDKRERIIFNIALKNKIPMTGVCRGGQFLNVMNGGSMWQHVDNHAIFGTHKIFDTDTGEEYDATSTHHQTMLPHKTAKILGVARRVSTKKERMGINGQVIAVMGKNHYDAEVIFYKKSKSLCFQPHPEYPGYPELVNRYFDYIGQHLNLR